MKKLLAVLLSLAMIFALVACGGGTTPANDTPDDKQNEETNNGEEANNNEETNNEDPNTEEAYVPLELNLKNKTGLTITGLYIYESGSADKGHSLCIAEWPDKDADGDKYEVNVLLYRKADVTHDLYVTFADGTDATWEGLTIANYDKLSLKGGVDPSGWKQEPVDDDADKALMDEVAATGRTADGFYPGYATLGLELKNKVEEELSITELYLYETGANAADYPNIIAQQAELIPDGKWAPGKGGVYLFGYFVRPVAATYELKAVFEDGSELIVPDIDLTTPDGDGNLTNEISLKSATDPDQTKIKYDDGIPEPINYISDAIVTAMPLDNYLPNVG